MLAKSIIENIRVICTEEMSAGVKPYGSTPSHGWKSTSVE